MTSRKKYADIITAESLSAYAPATRRMYAGAWKQFLAWSKRRRRRDILPVSPQDLVAYLDHLAQQGRKWATIVTHKATILKAHRRAGLPNPADTDGFAEELRRIARRTGKQKSQMTGLTEMGVAAITATAHIPRRTRGGLTETAQQAQLRADMDLAIIHTMRYALLRPSEAAALTWQDLEVIHDGTGRILIRRSKTDQAGEGALLFLSRTAVSALERIRPQDPEPDAPIFPMAAGQIRRRIKAAAKAAGLNGNFGGHSARIGMAVDLAQTGAGLPEIQQAGRWESPEMPAYYIRGITAGQGAVARYSANRNL